MLTDVELRNDGEKYDGKKMKSWKIPVTLIVFGVQATSEIVE